MSSEADLPASSDRVRVERGVPRRSLRWLRINSIWSTDVAIGVLVTLDVVAVIAAGLVSDILNSWQHGSLSNHIAGSAIAAIAILQANAQFKLYDLTFARRPMPMVDRVIMASSVAFGSLALVAWLADLPAAYPSSWKIGLFLLSLVFVGGGRLLFGLAVTRLSHRRLVSRNVVVIGAGPQGEMLLRQLERGACPWTRVLCVFDDRVRDPGARVGRRLLGRYSVLGTTKELVSFSRRIRVDDIFIALPWTSEARIREILASIEVIPANVHLWPDMLRDSSVIRRLASLDGMPVVTMASKPVAGWGYVTKWMVDKTLALAGLMLFSPLFVIVAIAIKRESPGPVFFRQSRLGFNNKVIEVYKFRSMYNDQRDERAERLVSKGDPRITPLGRILRRLSIDELPQLFNVLLGNMSLVGPRPHALQAKAAGHLYHDVVAEYALRHKMKPGITGWAQISGWRGETDTAEKITRRVQHDLYYMNNWSFVLDLYILAMTMLVPFHRNAY
jgi:Undecaprenyl-phosphate glucose phosphotransferase